MIMVGCPIHSRVEYVDGYMDWLFNLNFPHDKLRVVFLVNNAHDGTLEKLLDYQREESSTFNAFDVYVAPDFPDFVPYPRNYSLYAQLRNRWLSYRHNEDYVFSVDSDITVEPDSLKKLIKRDKDICSIAVNTADPSYHVYNFMVRQNGHLNHSPIPAKTLLEVDVTGAAYLIKKEVLNAGVEYGFHKNGEDVYFCDEAKKRGFGIYCDTSIVGKHFLGDRYVQ